MREDMCENIQVVVLMGGIGSRLKDKTKTCPKPMIKVSEKPFFEYQLELMVRAGFQRFLFCVGYHGEMIQNYFGDGSRWGIRIDYSYDGEKLLGTGGALVRALPFLEDDFLLIYGDSFMDVDYFEIVVRYHQAKDAGKKALMTVMRNRNRLDASNVICIDGEILLYDKARKDSQMEYIDYGISVFNRDIFTILPQKKFLDLADWYSEVVGGVYTLCRE